MRIKARTAVSVLAVFTAVWVAVRYLLPLILPFLLGAALALAAEPMVIFFRRNLHLPRLAACGIAVTMAFCFLAILMLLLGALALRELGVLAGILPDLEQAARSGVSALEAWLLNLSSRAPDSMEKLLHDNITGFFSDGTALLNRVSGYMLNLAGNVLGAIPGSAFTVGTAIISGYMISAKLPVLRRWILHRLPREKLKPLLKTLLRVKTTVFHWLKAQLQLSGVTFGILLISFLLLRVSYAPVWALAVSLVDAFPVLGTGTILLPWAVIALLQGSTAQAAGLAGTYIVISITRSVLEPKLLGKHLGLDPLLTLFVLYAGYKLWGIAGMILSPLMAVTALQLLPGTEGQR